jgi:hypothetical protein
MTEVVWVAAENTDAMLAIACRKASDRKARLLMCALARRLWHLLPDGRSRRAVEAAEEFADAQSNAPLLREAEVGAWSAHEHYRELFLAARRATRGKYRRHVKEARLLADVSAAAVWAASPILFGYADVSPDCGGDELGFYDNAIAVRELLRPHGGLFHEVFGNPFNPPRPDPAWLNRGDRNVERLAESIYRDRAFDCLPVLADALEDAGCTDGAILEHCRSGGGHVRGCWAVDLLLGKQ